MSKATTTVMTCDRCDGSQAISRHTDEYLWGRISAAQANGPLWIGSTDGKVFKDLCPSCMRKLLDWWRDGRPAPEAGPEGAA